MKLRGVEIRNFRSLRESSLDMCGDFNILIGRNNSGKSNLLSSIAIFFRALSFGVVVGAKESGVTDLDFHNRNVEQPLHIGTVFSLTDQEREQFFRSVIEEAPQLRNVVDRVDYGIDVHIDWTARWIPVAYGYVSRIEIRPSMSTEETGHAPTVVLQVPEAAAAELASRAERLKALSNETGALERFLSSGFTTFWRRYAREPKSERPSARALLDLYGREVGLGRVGRKTAMQIERILEEATTQEEATAEIDSLRQSVSEALDHLKAEKLENKIGTLSGEETNVPIYVSSLLEQVGQIGVLHLRERRTSIGVEEAEKLLALKVRRGGDSRLNTIQSTVPSLLGVKIDAYAGEGSAGLPASAELDVDDFLVQANGSGIKEALRIVLDFEFEQPQILLVEEPEIHLHPALEIAMMRFLQSVSRDCQVFITTHSTNLLDTAEMTSVYLVTRTGETAVQRVDYAAAEDSIPRELGMRLSSFFLFDRLVFVEGSTDERILRHFSSNLGVNLSQANVGFVHMGGSRNYAYFAAESTLSFLKRRGVQVWFVLDRDERSRQDSEELFARLKSDARVVIFDRREIENYLLMPRAIAELIRFKKLSANSGLDDGSPTSSDIEASIQGRIDDLKMLSISKRVAAKLCGPVRPTLKNALESDPGVDGVEIIRDELQRMKQELDRRLERLEEVHSGEQQAVDDAWDTQKTCLVQGDILLDLVFRDFGFRFRKETDGPRLASLMRPEEIPSELANLLRQVSK